MSKQSYRVCFCFRRKFRLTVSEAPEEVKALFRDYSENGIMTLDHLRRFLVEVQGEENATPEDAQAIITKLHEQRHLNIFQKKGVTIEAFFWYLFGDINSVLSPNLGVHHDMTAPLSHYFIFTGHNSYLTGNQLNSDCSDVPIIKALKKGVRVIELDIWPNQTKDDVHVLHGGTLTAPVTLIKCLRSIKAHAFEASEYPVVITLEDHLTSDLQAKVARMVNETFGDMLFTPGSDTLKEFPSPESLKKRVIISTKPPKEYLEAKEAAATTEVDPKKEKRPSDEDAWGKEVSSLKEDTETVEKDGKDDDFEEEEEEEEDSDGTDKPEQKAAPEYKHLIAIHAGKPKGGLSECLKVDPDKVRRLSLSEQQLENAVVNHGKEIVRFTQRNILRVYPKGVRVDSSNYNPLIGWSHGAQMVAFNMQQGGVERFSNDNGARFTCADVANFIRDDPGKMTKGSVYGSSNFTIGFVGIDFSKGYGRSLWVMQGMFRANGRCGYVKKPDFLLKSSGDDVFVPRATRPITKTLKVTVYMGEGWYNDFKHTHFDLYSPPDFYTRVGIAGVPADTIMKKTRAIEDNWAPSWNEVFEFPLTVPELALLRIEVHEYDMSEKDDFGGQTCLPISEIRTGIRAVPLCDRKGEPYSSVKLLMRFEFT